MLNMSNMVPFHSGQVENFYLLVLGQVLRNLMQFHFFFYLRVLMLHVSQQFFSHVGMITCLPGLNHYLAASKCLAQ